MRHPQVARDPGRAVALAAVPFDLVALRSGTRGSASDAARVKIVKAGSTHEALHPQFPTPGTVAGTQPPEPGELLHLDIRKLGKIGRVGHRIHGDRRASVRGIGWEAVHVAIDDCTRLAYGEVLADESPAEARRAGSVTLTQVTQMLHKPRCCKRTSPI